MTGAWLLQDCQEFQQAATDWVMNQAKISDNDSLCIKSGPDLRQFFHFLWQWLVFVKQRRGQRQEGKMKTLFWQNIGKGIIFNELL